MKKCFVDFQVQNKGDQEKECGKYVLAVADSIYRFGENWMGGK